MGRMGMLAPSSYLPRESAIDAASPYRDDDDNDVVGSYSGSGHEAVGDGLESTLTLTATPPVDPAPADPDMTLIIILGSCVLAAIVVLVALIIVVYKYRSKSTKAETKDPEAPRSDDTDLNPPRIPALATTSPKYDKPCTLPSTPATNANPNPDVAHYEEMLVGKGGES